MTMRPPDDGGPMPTIVCPMNSPCTAESLRRIEQLVLLGIVHVGLGDEVRAGVDEGLDLLTLGGGERGLDAVVAHPIGVLQQEGGDGAVLEIPNELVVGVEADELDRVALLVLGDRLARALALDEIVREDA